MLVIFIVVYLSVQNNKCLFQANGFNPSPTDTSNVVLSRELQVSLLSVSICLKLQGVLVADAHMALSFIQGDGGGGGRKLP